MGGTLEKGKRTRLRVAEGKKQETAIQPGSSRERKQRTANGVLQGPERRGQENPGRGPRQQQREDTVAERERVPARELTRGL